MTARTIIITGATRGLGRALVEIFLPQGHHVAGCGRSASDVAKLRAAFPAGHFDQVDVADRSAVEQWAKQLLPVIGPPDLLINNAGVMSKLGKLWLIPPEEFDRVVDVNIRGVYNCIRAFVPRMAARSAGVIVNLSSGWGRSTSPDVAAYCASKYAVEGLTKALAQELPNGMAAVPLNPGVIDTDMLRQAWGDSAGSYANAAAWAKRTAPILLGLNAADNGKSLTVPS